MATRGAWLVGGWPTLGLRNPEEDAGPAPSGGRGVDVSTVWKGERFPGLACAPARPLPPEVKDAPLFRAAPQPPAAGPRPPGPPGAPGPPGPRGWGCPLAAELRIRNSCLWAGSSSSPDAKKPTWVATWASLGALLTAGHALPTPSAAATILTPPTANNGLKMNSSACCSRCHSPVLTRTACTAAPGMAPSWPVL